MRKLLLTGMGVALLFFTGCSQKTPEVDMTQNGNTQQKIEKPGTTVANMNSVDSEQSINDMNKTDNSVSSKIAQLQQQAKTIHFDFDKYNIRKDQQPLVKADAGIINSDEAKNFSVKLEGNCDEWGTDEYNYALGLKRAKSVKSSLAALGVDTSRMMIISYGKSNPVCTAHTKACWAKNRRVDFKFLP